MLPRAYLTLEFKKIPGYNRWTLEFSGKKFTVKEKGKYLVNKEPFRMFHFSSIYTDYLEDMLKLSSSEQRKYNIST